MSSKQPLDYKLLVRVYMEAYQWRHDWQWVADKLGTSVGTATKAALILREKGVQLPRLGRSGNRYLSDEAQEFIDTYRTMGSNGFSINQIAEQLNIRPDRVREIRRKLNAKFPDLKLPKLAELRNHGRSQ